MTLQASGRTDVSIVVSMFRSERYLRQFERNVRRFARDIESTSTLTVELVLVLNAPSTAELRAVGSLRGVESHQVRLKSVEVPQETLYASWNRGIHLAEGGVIGFWNTDDDRYAPAVVEAAEGMRRGASLMYFPHVVDHRWRKWGTIPCRRRVLEPAREFDRDLFRAVFSISPFFMFSRALYETVGPFDEQFQIAGDFDWCVRALDETSFAGGMQVAGRFLDECQGLSTLGSERLIAERNVIFIRHGLIHLLQQASPSLLAEYDARRIRVGQSWVGIPRAQCVSEPSLGRSRMTASSELVLTRNAESLRQLAAADALDGRLTRLARRSARYFSRLARRAAAATQRASDEERIRRGDLRGVRRGFLRARPAYTSTAKFALALPIVMLSPRLYAIALRRRRRAS